METTISSEIKVDGMDCADCTRHVAKALRSLDGVKDAQVYLSTESAIIEHDPTVVTAVELKSAIVASGYKIHASDQDETTALDSNRLLVSTTALFVVSGTAMLIIALAEAFGWIRQISGSIPIPVYIVVIALGGWPVFQGVIQAAIRREVTSHTLMVVGMLAALAVGEWLTAVVIVLFMRVGSTVERLTTRGARAALRDLHSLTPQSAWVIRDGQDHKVHINEVRRGDLLVVRSGERIPVDGTVIAGQAVIDQSAITGESLPIEIEPGGRVFAASLLQTGSLQLRVESVGEETAFGKVVEMVERAEANQGRVQQFADRFSSYYLPIVLAIAALTLLFRRDVLAAAAVLVVVCSCAIALATPIAMLASIGSAAKRGLLIKGGRHIERLSQVDVLLIDKTGTLTLGKPVVTQVKSLGALDVDQVLALAAAVERYSEHPLAAAVTRRAQERKLNLVEPVEFKTVPGRGAQAIVGGKLVRVGNRRFITAAQALADEVEDSLIDMIIFVECDREVVGYMRAADKLRSDVPVAIQQIRSKHIKIIEILTGDHHAVAEPIASELEVAFRSELLPEQKLDIVRGYQNSGHVVAMVGDGVNDAPALAQADVGIALGTSTTDIAKESADIAILQDDWTLVTTLFEISDRTMRVVRSNLVFTGIYNLAGILLAASGILPPIFAAAAQSVPDVGILFNSMRLLKTK